MIKKKTSLIEDEDYTSTGGVWRATNVSVRVSGKANFILAKLKLLNPSKAKSLIIKDIIEKALIDIDKEINKQGIN
ncbi:TPA: hypothetical protein ACHJX8_004452 [Yersinia enterocolitica]|uniref:hypothetical protein n=1 Tax=Yersinia massiliensis TaxID=419257 RepID=UPI001561DF54|nr:hypothetical protein [Yersinia massiliensis]QKJ09285.1 hypothetical protein HRD68_00225 [Yersinia massiliensis]HDX9051775.1 hypothetical protein [Yersinia enterocolitica]